MSSSAKKASAGDSPSTTGNQMKASSPINQPIPILNIPNPGGSSSSKSPDVSSSSQEVGKSRRNDDPEVMVLDDDEEMDHEV